MNDLWETHQPQPKWWKAKLARYFDKKPGYLRDEVRSALRRLTDHQFIRAHSGGPRTDVHVRDWSR